MTAPDPSQYGGATLHGVGQTAGRPDQQSPPHGSQGSSAAAESAASPQSAAVATAAPTASAAGAHNEAVPRVAGGNAGPAPMPTPQRQPRPGKSRPPRAPRRARLQLRGISVWSALRFSVVLSIALFCVWMVMVGVLYGILDGVGAIDKLNEAIFKIDPEGAERLITPGMVFGGGIVIGAVYMVLFIALATVGTIIYNLCADLVGGVEVTLAERE